MSAALLLLALTAQHPSRSLTFDEAQALAAAHPRLSGQARAVGRKGTQDDRISSLSQNPTVGISPGWRRFDEGEGFEGIVSVGQGFDLGGSGTKRRRAARARTRAASAEVEVLALQIRTRVASEWIALRAAQQIAATLREEEDVAAQLVATIERGVEAGRFLAVELADANIYRAETELLRRTAEGVTVDLSHAVASELALPAETAVVATGDAPVSTLPESLASTPWLSRAAALPAARFAALLRATRDHELASVVANNTTKLGTSVSLQREATGDVIGLVGLSVTLPVFNRSEDNRGDAVFAAAVGELDEELGLLEAQRSLVVALHEVEHMREVSAQVEQVLLPAAERYASLVRRQLEQGRIAVVDALRARRRVIEERRRQIESERARLDAEVRAALLLGSIAEDEAPS